MYSRRTVLAAVSSVLTAAAGCLSRHSENPSPAIDSIQRLGTDARLSFVVDPVREYTYLPEDEIVRYEEEFNGVTHTEQMPFREWGTRQAAAHARNRLWSRFTTQYRDYEFVASSVGSIESVELEANKTAEASTENSFKRAVDIAPKLRYNMWYNDQTGEIVRKPPISWETFVAAVPQTVEVTMVFPEREYNAVLPGVCQRVVRARPQDRQ